MKSRLIVHFLFSLLALISVDNAQTNSYSLEWLQTISTNADEQIWGVRNSVYPIAQEIWRTS